MIPSPLTKDKVEYPFGGDYPKMVPLVDVLSGIRMAEEMMRDDRLREGLVILREAFPVAYDEKSEETK